jgi:HEPN domain-containing protein
MTKAALVTEWMAYANTDLETARYLTGMHPEPTEIICFHCQQAAEKALKAYLVQCDIRPPKTHDLFELISLCSISTLVPKLRDHASTLNDYSVIARYPGAKDILPEDKDEALRSAEAITSSVKELLLKTKDA